MLVDRARIAQMEKALEEARAAVEGRGEVLRDRHAGHFGGGKRADSKRSHGQA